jgi:hypothetical protein
MYEILEYLWKLDKHRTEIKVRDEFLNEEKIYIYSF